ncbi:hypothetical protein DY000_02060758 [Brassica cretica]|uniref:F-box domain-containing protein n=1 Tax=Brassica cretica TaxID=69181 RepID=A0ABQ7AS24_BRACR|nr:hypothetical protein DY000_02060758 [Brassica cretica]
MANFNLASLPPSILHKILSKVATTSIRDFGCARVSFPGSMLLEHSGLSATNWVIQRPSTCEMYHMITSWVLSGHWGYGKPEMFMSLLERIDPNACYDSWDFCNEIHLTTRDWLIGD